METLQATKVSRKKAEKYFNLGFQIFLLPSKMRLNSNWFVRYMIDKNNTYTFNGSIDSFIYYNCSKETGKQVHFYILDKDINIPLKLERYTLKYLKSLPTIEQTHFSNIKIQTEFYCIMLSRMQEKGYKNRVYVETLINGNWTQTQTYIAR